jgi:hypothetical protein
MTTRPITYGLINNKKTINLCLVKENIILLILCNLYQFITLLQKILEFLLSDIV